MNKQEKEQKRDELSSKITNKISFLQEQINSLTLQFNEEVKKRQDEIDSLSLQNDSLTEYKIK